MSGTLSLDRSLRMEWRWGFIGLPALAQVMLPKGIAKMMKGSVAERKGWLVLIRQARKNIGDGRTANEFLNPKSSLRRLVSL